MEQTHDSPTALELYKGHPVQEAAQIILGSLLFSASMNWIILPHDMYSGGFLGNRAAAANAAAAFLPCHPADRRLGGHSLFSAEYSSTAGFPGSGSGTFSLQRPPFASSVYSAFLALIPIPAEGLFDETIAACVIGGVSFVGGIGKIRGIIIGVLMLRLIFVGLTMIQVPQDLIYLVKGGIILFACALDMRKYLVKK